MLLKVAQWMDGCVEGDKVDHYGVFILGMILQSSNFS